MFGCPGPGPYPGPGCGGPGEATELFMGPFPSLAPLAGRGGIETLPSLDWPMAGDMDRELEEPVGEGEGRGRGEGEGRGRGEPADCLTAGSALSGLPSSLRVSALSAPWSCNTRQ